MTMAADMNGESRPARVSRRRGSSAPWLAAQVTSPGLASRTAAITAGSVRDTSPASPASAAAANASGGERLGGCRRVL